MAARRPVPVVKDPKLWSVFELDQSSPLVVSERWARDLVGTIRQRFSQTAQILA
jgi:hypothetical protein